MVVKELTLVSRYFGISRGDERVVFKTASITTASVKRASSQEQVVIRASGQNSKCRKSKWAKQQVCSASVKRASSLEQVSKEQVSEVINSEMSQTAVRNMSKKFRLKCLFFLLVFMAVVMEILFFVAAFQNFPVVSGTLNCWVFLFRSLKGLLGSVL